MDKIMGMMYKFLVFMMALTLASTNLVAGETKTKDELEEIINTTDSSLLIHKLVIKKPTDNILNSLSFNFDASLIRAMADTHIRRFFNATGKNLKATLWVDEKYWKQSQYFDQYMAVVTEENAFKRKRAEQALIKLLSEATDVTDKIVGQKFVIASEINSTYKFDFDTMSKRFTDDLESVLTDSSCLPKLSTEKFDSVNVPPSVVQTSDHSTYGYYEGSNVKRTIRGAGFNPEIIFQKPIEGSFADLISPMKRNPCAFQASFDDVEKAERFEEIMTGGAIIYYTGEITMYESPEVLIAELEKAELYAVNAETGEAEKTQFTWSVRKSLNPVESLADVITKEENPNFEYSDFIDSPFVYSTSSASKYYLQFKGSGNKLFMSHNQEAVAEYRLREILGRPVYEMVRAVGKPTDMPIRIFIPESKFMVDSIYRLNTYSMPRMEFYGFKVKLKGDLEEPLNK